MIQNQVSAQRWEGAILWFFPPAWRRDERAADVIATTVASAEADGRDWLGPYELLDLAQFGLRMRCEQIGSAIPRAARTLMAWGGLLSGVIVAAMLLVAPAAESGPNPLTGGVPWPTVLMLGWLALAIAVFVGRRNVVRGVAAMTIILTAIAPFAAHHARAACCAGRWPLSGDAVLSGPPMFVVLPLWLFSVLCLDARSLLRASRSARAVLVLAAALGGIVYGHAKATAWLSAPPSLSAPPTIPRGAVIALAILAAALIGLLAAAPRSAPAALLLALPWLLPVTLVHSNYTIESLLVKGWLAALLISTAVAYATWRPRTSAC